LSRLVHDFHSFGLIIFGKREAKAHTSHTLLPPSDVLQQLFPVASRLFAVCVSHPVIDVQGASFVHLEDRLAKPAKDLEACRLAPHSFEDGMQAVPRGTNDVTKGVRGIFPHTD